MGPMMHLSISRAAGRSAAAWVCAALVAAVPARAQQRAPALTLQEALSVTLARNASIAVAREGAIAARGERLSAAGVFDPSVQTVLEGGRDQRSALTSDGLVGPRPLVTNTAGYSVTVRKQTRYGVYLQPSVEVLRTDVDVAPPTSSSGRVNLGLGIPLLRDRGGSATRAPERAALARVDAAVLGLRHQTGIAVHEAADAFWEYLAARRRVEVYQEAERRSERLAGETRTLVAADERPASDLNQLMANLASKRIARISAEQEEVAARRRLGLVMGLTAEEVGALPPPAGDFPRFRPFRADSATVARLVAGALAGRADLAQAGASLRSAEVLASAARHGLRPRLDLSFSLGYAGLQTGPGAGNFLADPLFSHVPGPTSTVRLDYLMPLANSEGRGALMQHAAEVRRQRLAREYRELQVETAVRTSAQALERAALSAEEARSAVALYRTTLANERTKHAAGAATLFEVLYAEDNLTNAMLTLVAIELGYTRTVLALRFETATLLDGAEAVVDVETLVTPP
jgi:outer membrane protein TolC